MGAPAARSAYLGWVSAAIAGERGASPAIAAAEHDLILGYATGYEAADVAVFVRSLRAAYAGLYAAHTGRGINAEVQALLEDMGLSARKRVGDYGYVPQTNS